MEVNGQDLRCLVCKGAAFTEMHGAAMFGRTRQGNLVPGPINSKLQRGLPTTAWVCDACGFVHTFLNSSK